MKIIDLISEKDAQKLEKAKVESTKNNSKVAGRLFANLLSAALQSGTSLETKGRKIVKVRLEIPGENDPIYIWAKPLIMDNKIKLYWKNKYFDGAEIFGEHINLY